jgi:uncharacterized protein (TIGR03086 family)
MSENLQQFTQSVYTLDAVVARTAADAWDNDSPCEGWSARDVVGHAVGVLNGITHFASGGDPQFPETPDDLSAPAALWSECRDEVLGALDQPGALQHRDAYWFGDMSVDDLIGIVQWDPMTHAWDLGRAVGVEPVLDAALAAGNLQRAEAMGDALRGMGLIAEPVEISADASVVDRYLGAVGRNPS